MNFFRLHVAIICWTGRENNAQIIANDITPLVDKLTVIYSNRYNKQYEGGGNWIKVPDEWFYGRKFELLLNYIAEDFVLLIQADANCDDWCELINTCKEAYQRYTDLGVWVPKVEGTPFKPVYDDLWTTPDGRYRNVGLIDGITWCFSKSVANYLRTFNYSLNNLGWGIEAAAVAYCYSHGFLVLRSHDVEIQHTQGAGYDGLDAKQQELAFLTQLSHRESHWHRILKINHWIMAFCRKKLKKLTFIGDVAGKIMQVLIRLLARYYVQSDR